MQGFPFVASIFSVKIYWEKEIERKAVNVATVIFLVTDISMSFRKMQIFSSKSFTDARYTDSDTVSFNIHI